MKLNIKLLLAEDDVDLGSVLQRFLEMNGFSVTLCRDGNKAYNIFQDEVFDLIILDIMMPGIDGFMLAGKIREKNKTVPLIFLTVKNTTDDKLTGLRLEADDYITKPFDPDELVQRVKNILKRSKNYSPDYKIGKYTLKPESLKLIYDENEFNLTLQECRLLQLLLDRKGQILKREEILENVWGKNDYFLGRSLDVFISRLRKKLSSDGSIEIENIRGIGFRLHEKSE